MVLVDARSLIEHAYRHRYAVGAFTLVAPEVLPGVLEGAEQMQAPVLIGIDAGLRAMQPLDWWMPAVEHAARTSRIPVVVHYSRARTADACVRAIRYGCNSLGMDVRTLPDAERFARLREVAETVHACGVPLEVTLDLPGDPVSRSGVSDVLRRVRPLLTDGTVDWIEWRVPRFAGENGQRECGDATTVRAWIQDVASALSAPIALAADEWPEDALSPEHVMGLVKVDYGHAMRDIVAQCLQTHGHRLERFLRAVRSRVCAFVAECVREIGSAGQADRVLAEVPRFDPVEHRIVYNVRGMDEAAVGEMMAEGRRTLGAIPGVQRVFTGVAVREDAPYRYVWLIRFCHPNVIAAYRDHPDHVRFADRRFRPVAGDRITIDFIEWDPA